jgi:hypothetical protein
LQLKAVAAHLSNTVGSTKMHRSSFVAYPVQAAPQICSDRTQADTGAENPPTSTKHCKLRKQQNLKIRRSTKKSLGAELKFENFEKIDENQKNSVETKLTPKRNRKSLRY